MLTTRQPFAIDDMPMPVPWPTKYIRWTPNQVSVAGFALVFT
jgi:hypothetical protein